MTEHVDPLGRTTEMFYDELGHETEEIDAVGTTMAATTIMEYDAAGNMTEEYTPATSLTLANTTLFEFDDGNMTMSVNAMGYTSYYGYDSDGQMTSEIDADGRLQLFGWVESHSCAGYAAFLVSCLTFAS